jgi:hypothetical protein
MMLRRFSCVVGRIHGVPMRYVSVMAGFLVVPTFVVLRGFTMVFGCVLMVLRRLVVVLYGFVFHFG